MSDVCLNTLIEIFRADLTGLPSLEIVRLLNRMVKEQRYNVHPNVLSCLLHLRLKTELGVRSSDCKADKEPPTKQISKGRAAARRAQGKPTDQPHLSKRAKKALKERKEIEREFRDAEAEVDKEERSNMVSTVGDPPCLPCRDVPLCFTAYRVFEVAFCSLLQHTEEPSSYTIAPSSVARHIQICTSCEHRLFQRSHQGFEGADNARSSTDRRRRHRSNGCEKYSTPSPVYCNGF